MTLLLLSHRAVLAISGNGGEWAACVHKGAYFILCISGGKGKGNKGKEASLAIIRSLAHGGKWWGCLVYRLLNRQH